MFESEFLVNTHSSYFTLDSIFYEALQQAPCEVGGPLQEFGKS